MSKKWEKMNRLYECYNTILIMSFTNGWFKKLIEGIN